jgi:hypothetical protein
MLNIKNPWMNKKQAELIKIAFSTENLTGKLDEWHEKYGLMGLDNKTRAVLPVLIQKIDLLGISKINHPIYKKYHQYYKNIWLSNLKKMNKFNEIVEALVAQKIDICLLKGASMLIFYYKNMGMRPENSDIDILISPENLSKAVTILKFHGFKTFERASEFIEKQLDDSLAFPKTYLHAITLYRNDLVIDIHWRHLKFYPKPTFNLLKNEMKLIQLKNNPVYILSIEQQLIHLCINGMSDPGNCNFIWILDLLFILENYKETIDVKKIQHWAEFYQATTFLNHAIKLIQEVNPNLATSFNTPKAIFKKDPAILNFLYKIQFGFYPPLRKISFYLCIYLSKYGNKSLWRKTFSLRNFIKYYFGVPKNKSVSLFFFKNLIISLRKKI